MSFLKYNTEEVENKSIIKTINTRKTNKIKVTERQGSLVKKEENINKNKKKNKK
jgi:hypothetical protein